MKPYAVRYFFDPGAGVCLWAANQAAQERFGYAVDWEQLPELVRQQGDELLTWFDTSVNWDDPCWTLSVVGGRS